MRLIDADALLKQFEIRQEQQTNEYCDCFLNDAQELSTEWWCVEDAVTAAPTIDAVPVVHGRWVKTHTTEENVWNCSACGYPVGIWTAWSRFCPNCGAKMLAKEEDNEG